MSYQKLKLNRNNEIEKNSCLNMRICIWLPTKGGGQWDSRIMQVIIELISKIRRWLLVAGGDEC